MVGDKYWSVGITVWFTGRNDEWAATSHFFDYGFLDPLASEGEVRVRYSGPLSKVVDVAKADVERLGIQWGASGEGGTVYYNGDGVDRTLPTPPPDWRERVNAEARRLGWRECYRAETTTQASPGPAEGA